VSHHQVSATVVRALRGLQARGLVEGGWTVPSRVPLSRPPAGRPGDFTTAVPMRLGGSDPGEPLRVADLLAGELRALPGVRDAQVEGAGFVTVELSPEARTAPVLEAVRQGAGYGEDPAGRDAARARLRLHRAAPVEGADDDTVRFLAARHRGPGEPRVDETLARTADTTNPAYLVRYAHARLVRVEQHARDLGLPPPTRPGAAGDLRTLTRGGEERLVRAVADFPAVVEAAVLRSRASLLTDHLETTAETSLAHQAATEVLPQGDRPVDGRHRARLVLAVAVRTVLGNGLALLGVDAPDRM
jgi:arginyl-tRNA synthetase